MSKTYILQKDLPGVKAGREIVDEGLFVFCEPTTRFERMYRFLKEEIENNTEWFLPKEDSKEYEILERFDNKIFHLQLDVSEIKSIRRLSDGVVFSVGDRISFKEEDRCEINGFIINNNGLRVVGEDKPLGYKNFYTVLFNLKDIQHFKQPKLYTEEEVLKRDEEAFKNGMIHNPKDLNWVKTSYFYKIFQDYKNSQTKNNDL